VVIDRSLVDPPWAGPLQRLLAGYSTNRDYVPYSLEEELTSRGLFAPEGRRQTAPIPFVQSVGDYIESFHSRNGFSRERMGARANEFDAELAALVRPYAAGARLSFQLVANIIWGRPAG
jgi:hypothetical protein